MEDVFDKSGKPRPDVLKKHFVQEGRVEEDVALKIIADGGCGEGVAGWEGLRWA